MAGARAQGFVLILVLGMLVILSLLAGGIGLTTARLRDHALERQRQLADQIDIASTKATLFYLLSTQPMTVGGLTVDDQLTAARARAEAAAMEFEFNALPVGNEISLDSRPFRGLGDVRFALQDDGGLFGVKLQSPQALGRLMAVFSGSTDLPPSVLIDRLMDYQDKDDLYRLNSLEKDGYARLGLPGPSNRPLTTPMELLRIPGWAEALGGMSSRDIHGTITAEFIAMPNANTAPPAVLRTIEGVDGDHVARILARRQVQPFLTGPDFYEFLGIPVAFDAAISLYPSPSGTLMLWASRGGQARLVHWTLTPAENGGRPWREDYELIYSQDTRLEDAALPVRSRLFGQPVAATR